MPSIRVASVPAGHVYVRHLGALGQESPIIRLADPPPAEGPDTGGRWWPPAMLDPAWIEAHADEFDVFHVHFGFDAMQPRQLSAVVASVRRAGKPLVYTVHDLRNPHHAEAQAHDAALDVLIREADALITLTAGAANVIGRRWGRRARVIPHPHVVELERIRPRNRLRREFVVGIHAKSVRANMSPLAVLDALMPLREELADLQVRFDVHHEVFDGDGRRHDPALAAYLAEAAANGDIQLNVHDFFTDEELWTYLESLDLSVLPYAYGTHSGWLEACYDTGTTVLAPHCGFYAQQRPCLTYRHDESGLDAQSLRDGVRRAHRRAPFRQATRAERASERDEIAAAHYEVYSSVLT